MIEYTIKLLIFDHYHGGYSTPATAGLRPLGSEGWGDFSLLQSGHPFGVQSIIVLLLQTVRSRHGACLPQAGVFDLRSGKQIEIL
jgi:hypothetical protein